MIEDNQKPLPQLDATEQRIIGSLIEKSKTTPDYYPMTLNGLTAACNQKTARNPVVSYDEQTVTLTLNALKSKGLVATVTGGSSRVTKWKHNLGSLYELTPDELAVICLLLLRGPLTPGEINTNAGRLYEFDDIEEVQTVLHKLANAAQPFVQQMEKRPGQKESRYIHLLGQQFATENPDLPATTTNASYAELEERVTTLEQQLAALRKQIDFLLN